MLKLSGPIGAMVVLLAAALTGCEEPEPVASFTPSKLNALVDETIVFSNTSQNAESYNWDFGDGTSSTEKSPTHVFTADGTFTVKLTATGEGGSNEASLAITVTFPEPVAQFAASKTTVVIGELVSFTNQSQYADSYIWDFGDGTGSQALSPTHGYAQEGTFMVTLTVTGGGGTDDAFRVINVIIPPVNIYPGDKIGPFILGKDLGVHFTHIFEETFAYGTADLQDGTFLHLMEFDTTGIGFVLITTSQNLIISDIPFGIYGFMPFIGTTEEGITFGSRLVDVQDAYGTPDEVEEDGSYSYLTSLGISFWADATQTFVQAIYISKEDSLLKSRPVHDFSILPFSPDTEQTRSSVEAGR